MAHDGGTRGLNTDPKTGSLSPLPRTLSVGLIPVAALGGLSFLAATSLFFLLVYRMIQWRRRSRAINQFIFLIANLLLADIQQSLAFLLNAEWLVRNAIEVETRSCWAQGCTFLTLILLFPFILFITFSSARYQHICLLCECRVHINRRFGVWCILILYRAAHFCHDYIWLSAQQSSVLGSVCTDMVLHLRICYRRYPL
jgi:hypothetical protein